jgi:hypothetical protein
MKRRTLLFGLVCVLAVAPAALAEVIQIAPDGNGLIVRRRREVGCERGVTDAGLAGGADAGEGSFEGGSL